MLYLFVDETSWSKASYGGAGFVVDVIISNKSGVTKGGQIFLVRNFCHVRMHAYMHWHKVHQKPPGWTVMDHIKVKTLIESMQPIIEG